MKKIFTFKMTKADGTVGYLCSRFDWRNPQLNFWVHDKFDFQSLIHENAAEYLEILQHMFKVGKYKVQAGETCRFRLIKSKEKNEEGFSDFTSVQEKPGEYVDYSGLFEGYVSYEIEEFDLTKVEKE